MVLAAGLPAIMPRKTESSSEPTGQLWSGRRVVQATKTGAPSSKQW